MLRKTNSQKGFTIIEVVITIAIGAAVMALVLNAVAGARRSQRNNARAADVNAVAAGVNQYIATRNALPPDWASIAAIVDPTKFGHYDKTDSNANTSINTEKGWLAARPNSADAGKFTWAALMGGATWQALVPAQIGEDEVVVVQKAGCSSNSVPAAGGIREMAIVYKLEGQTLPICLEI